MPLGSKILTFFAYKWPLPKWPMPKWPLPLNDHVWPSARENVPPFWSFWPFWSHPFVETDILKICFVFWLVFFSFCILHLDWIGYVFRIGSKIENRIKFLFELWIFWFSFSFTSFFSLKKIFFSLLYRTINFQNIGH